MPKITKIEAQKRKGRFNIYTDGQFLVGVGEDLLVEEELSVGKEMKPKKVQDLIFSSKREKLFEKALDLLAYRPRSKQEIRNKLWKKVRKLKVRKDLREYLVERTLIKLEDNKYLDDAQFSEWWVEERIRSRPRGKMLLRNELFKKGVDRELIDNVLKDYSTDDELSWARKLLEKRASRYENLSSRERKEKIFSYLARRGFSWKIIKIIFED